MKLIRVTFVVSALAVLGGCVAVPVNPGDYAGSPGHYHYDAPASAYYAPSSIGLGLHGGRRGYGRSYGR